jgi:hypothetical protein
MNQEKKADCYHYGIGIWAEILETINPSTGEIISPKKTWKVPISHFTKGKEYPFMTKKGIEMVIPNPIVYLSELALISILAISGLFGVTSL